MNFIERRLRAWLDKQYDAIRPIQYHPGEALRHGHILLHTCGAEQCGADGKRGFVLLVRKPNALIRLLDSDRARDDYWVPIATLAAPL